MKRQTVILATFLIAVFATAAIFAEVSAAQQPIAPTTKITTVTKDNQNLRGAPYYPGDPGYDPGYPIYPPINPPIIVTPPIYFPIL